MVQGLSNLAIQSRRRRKKVRTVVTLSILFLLGLVIVNFSSGYKLLATEEDHLQTASLLSEYIRMEYAIGGDLAEAVSKAKEHDDVGFTINYDEVRSEVVIFKDLGSKIKTYERVTLK